VSRGSLTLVSGEPPTPPSIAVIGGGFSGVAVAAQLLRRGRPARVTLVNRFGPIGRGVLAERLLP
jgi:NADPH-dependent 2,4-dienoyl-CoA reductase/sulfur reductase-like enzyme